MAANYGALVDYIRRAAQARGIDPNVAVSVARGEGGLSNPYRHGEGPAPKTQDPRFGDKENSFGPFQLYISGTGAGLGDKALASGIDPRKNWQAGVDYALDAARKSGWGQWYGAKAQGITGMMGISGAPAANTAPPDATATAHPSLSPAPQQTAQAAPQAAPQATPAPSATLSVPDYVQKLAGLGGSSQQAANPFAAMLASSQQAPQFSPVQFQGPSADQANALSTLVEALKNRMV